jgi:hypothetical protein
MRDPNNEMLYDVIAGVDSIPALLGVENEPEEVQAEIVSRVSSVLFKRLLNLVPDDQVPEVKRALEEGNMTEFSEALLRAVPDAADRIPEEIQHIARVFRGEEGV